MPTMRYYKKNNQEFIENGRSKVIVGTLDHIPSPKTPGRILKMLTVVEVVQQNLDDPILPGQCVALSFPESQVNNKDYVWNQDGPEETLVPLVLKLT